MLFCKYVDFFLPKVEKNTFHTFKKIFFQKGLDKSNLMCYNNDRKEEREDKKMREYFVSVGSAQFAVSGCEAAYEAFRKACDFADLLGVLVTLADGETGEILADNQGDE